MPEAVTPNEAITEARGGQLRPVYLVVGEEGYLRDEVTRALKAAALEGGVPGLNEDQYIAGDSDVESVLQVARTLPMMATRRLVVVRQLERWEPKDASKSKSSKPSKSVTRVPPLDRLVDYAEKPSATTVLLLTGGKVDKRRRLFGHARQNGYLVSCDAPSPKELPGWIMGQAKQRGNPIDASTASLLAEFAGPELSNVADALERVCLFAGEARPVTEDIVTECVLKVRSTTVWQLVGAVGRRDVGGALGALAEVYDPADRGLRLVGVLAWSTRQLLRFEAATRAGARAADAAKAAGAPPFKARELADQVRQLPRAKLETWLQKLSEVDLALKGGSARPPRAVVEAAIIELCAS